MKIKNKLIMTVFLIACMVFILPTAENNINRVKAENILGQDESPNYPANPTTKSGVVTWDCVYFGSYWQEDLNARTPIKWRVISVDGDDAFLLADMNLDCKQYHTDRIDDVTWESSYIRKWLNSEFVGSAFTKAEQDAINETAVVNDGSYPSSANGNTTTDKIYLLSASEGKNADYGFGSRVNAKNTKYAEKRGAITYSSSGCGPWWLRTLKNNTDSAFYVEDDGYVALYSADVDNKVIAVRPVLHLNLLSSDQWNYAGTVNSNGEAVEVLGKVTAKKPCANISTGTYTTEQTVTLTTATAGATIYYTTDGTLPSETNGNKYSSPFKLSKQTTVKAIAAKDGLFSSDIMTEKYTINIPIVKPADPKPDVKTDIKVKKISLTGISKNIAAGKKLTVTAAVSPANATNKNFKWKSSNTKYATVTNKGVVVTKKAGAGKNVTITATAADGSNIKAVYKIKIMKHAVKSVKIKNAPKNLKAGKSKKLTTSITTTGKSVNKKLEWTTSNKNYMTVTSAGKVTAKKAGKGKSVKIMAMATDGTGKKNTVNIKIN